MDYTDYFETHPEPRSSPQTTRPWLNSQTFLFIIIVLILVGWGLISLYSASYDEALRLELPPSYFFTRQAVFALLGFFLFFLISFIPMKWISIAVFPLLVLSLVLMLLTLLTPFGVEKMGARRWLDLPLLPSFQPSELVKIAVILAGARLFSGDRKKENMVWFFAILLVSSALMILQKDYSTTAVFLATTLTLTLIAGIHLLPLLIFVGALAVPAVIFLLIEPYRIRRVVSFLFPDLDPSGMNYQVNRAIEAIQSGGLFGKGLGKGTYKLGLIPEVHSDFIFASLAEETGIMGITVLALLFVLLFFFGIRTSREALVKSPFLSYVAAGFSIMIVLQAAVNIAVVTRLLPPTGIPLPFFSQGGTNLLVVIVECALIFRCMKEVAE